MSDATSGEARLTVVLVDDDPLQLRLITSILQLADAEETLGPLVVESFTDAAEALSDLPVSGRVVVLCDHHMPGANGLDWLPDFVRAGVGPVILLTGSADARIAAEAFRKGAADFLSKQVVTEDPTRLLATIRESLRRHSLEHRNRELKRRLKLMNAELERKNHVLGAMTETAHRFVDNVAHEFRTPLAVIQEFAAILNDGIGGEVTDPQREYLHYITSACRDLAMLVDDFLDSGKLKAQTLRVDRRRHPVAAIIESVRPLVTSRAGAKGIEVVERIDADLEDVFADLEKAGRVLINLAVNAVKFSPSGSSITIATRRIDSRGVEVCVTDEGPGLPADEVRRIFERFRQAGALQSTCAKGFGLGLGIAREFARLNLGTVDVQSEPGRGSTFSFTLPTCDPATCVEWYLRSMEAEPSRAALSLLRATAASTAAEDFRCVLASLSHPTDLLLVGPDGAAVTLLGRTMEPDKWQARLQGALRERQELDPDREIGTARFEWLGTWSGREAREPIIRAVAGGEGDSAARAEVCIDHR